MLNFLGRPISSFNLEITNRCMLQCSACARTNNQEILKDLKDLPTEILDNLFDPTTLASLPNNFQALPPEGLTAPDRFVAPAEGSAPVHVQLVPEPVLSGVYPLAQ